MFCVRCGKENRDDASFCVLCGANLGQIPQPLVLERPSSTKRTLWIAGAVALTVVLAIMISTAVHAWVLNQSDQSKHVIV